MQVIEKIAEPRWGKWCYVEVDTTAPFFRAILYDRHGTVIDAIRSDTEEQALLTLRDSVLREVCCFPDKLTRTIYDVLVDWLEPDGMLDGDERIACAQRIRALIAEGVA